MHRAAWPGRPYRDAINGETLAVKARIVVNAAGVWADRVTAMATETRPLLRPSKGVHLVFRPGAVRTSTGVLVPSGADDGGFVFVIPWGDRAYAGTTDTPYEGDLDRPDVSDADRGYIVSAVAASFPGVTDDDVVASWAGLRPLLAGTDGAAADAATRDLSRRHALFDRPAGLLTITGGKLTAYRAMAEEVVDRVSADLGRKVASATRRIPLGFSGDLGEALMEAEGRAPALGLPVAAGRRMVHRFGDDWPEALGMIAAEPSLAEPAVDGLPVLKVELEMARRREMAITGDDVVVRRTRLTTMDELAAAAQRPRLVPGSPPIPGARPG